MEDFQVNFKFVALSLAKSDAYRFDLLAIWRTWYASSYVHVLHESAHRALSLGIDAQRMWIRLLRGHEHPITFDVYRKAKSTVQREFTKQIRCVPSMNLNHEHLLRHKLTRWQLDAPLGLITHRLLCRLGRLKSLVAPRVQSAVFKTIWNGWCTSARFQSKQACVLSCSCDALDRFEHYAACPPALHSSFLVWPPQPLCEPPLFSLCRG